MDLIKSTDSKYEEYENLLLERDQITKEAGQIWTVYLQLFGKLITDNYEEKLECIKCKKTIAYYQNALNHGGVVDSAAMEKYMEQEMAEYYANAIWGIFSNWFIVADTSMSTIDFFNPGDILYGFDFGMDQKDYHRLSADDKANGIRHGDNGAVRCIKN